VGGTGDVEGSEDFTLLTLVTLLRVHLEDSPGDCPSSIVGEVGVEVTTGVDTSCGVAFERSGAERAWSVAASLLPPCDEADETCLLLSFLKM